MRWNETQRGWGRLRLRWIVGVEFVTQREMEWKREMV